MNNGTTRVLMVDDNESDFLLVRELLAEIPEGHWIVQRMPNSDGLLEALSRGEHDVCLLDYHLGGDTGLELLATLLKDHFIPIILLTGMHNRATDVAVAKVGASDYLLKNDLSSPLLERSIRYALQRQHTQNALQEARTLAQATVDALPQNIAVISQDGTIVAVNKAWVTFAQENGMATPGHGLGLNFLTSCDRSGKAGQAVADGVRAVLNWTSPFFEDYSACHSPTVQRWLKMTATPFPGSGQPNAVVAYEDITLRVLAEAQLRQSQANLAEAQRIAGLGRWALAAADVTSALDAPLQLGETTRGLLHLAPDASVSLRSFSAMAHIFDQKAFTQALETTFQTGQALSEQVWVFPPNSDPIYVHIRAELNSGSGLAQVALVGTIQDNTERKKVEDARDRFFTMSLDLLGLATLDGYFQEVNPAFTEVLGYSESELLSRPFLDLVHPEDVEATRQSLVNLSQGQVVVGFENRFLSKDGAWHWLEWRATIAAAEGVIYAAARDITDRKSAEAELIRMSAELEQRVVERTAELHDSNRALIAENCEKQVAMGSLREVMVVLENARQEAEFAREEAVAANLAKSEFLSRMSHELRTPLNAILGFGQILEMQSADASEQQLDNVRQILFAGRHLLDLINEVLDIARIETGHVEMALEPVPIAPIIRDSLKLVHGLAKQNNVSLVNELDVVADSFQVLADVRRLKQILLNVLSNAVKYNQDNGSVFVSLTTVHGEAFHFGTETSTEYLRIAVRDTGVGISEADLPRLFVPFERLQGAKTKVDGVGIGLALSKDLVQAMGGGIGVESTPGVGTTFAFTLPLVFGMGSSGGPRHQVHSSSLKAELGVVSGETTNKSLLILQIGDTLQDSREVQGILGNLQADIRVLTALRGSTGLKMALDHLPDLILLDMKLPDMVGEYVLRQLQAEPKTKNIKVAVLSSDKSPRTQETMMAAGAIAYLVKPVDIATLAQLVQTCLTGPANPNSKV